MGGEAAADFLGGAVQAANGDESVRACADEQNEKPTEGEQQETADFFGVLA